MAERSPNFVIILADDHCACDLGCGGHPFLQTPHLDALAADGVRFDHAMCTSPLCTPSRVCYQLGQWERCHGVNFGSRSAVSPEAWSMSYPMQLKRAGYFTGYVGKNHSPVGHAGYSSGQLERDFDFWYANHGHSGFYPKEWHPIYANAAADTQAEIFAEGVDNFFQPDPDFYGGARVPLARRPQGQPFCLSLNFNLPHPTGTSTMQQRATDPPLYRDTYREQWANVPIPAAYRPWARDQTRKLPEHVYSRLQIPEYDYVNDEESLREQHIRYCQTITGIDRVVGRVVEQLRALGELENTVIVYAADHGILSGEHGLGGKTLLYEPSLRIPFIVWDPSVPAARRGRVNSSFVVPADLGPFVLSRAGRPVPGAMQGRDLTPLVCGEAVPWRSDVFCEGLMTIQAYPRSEAVRDRRWKYIRYFTRAVGETEPDTPWQKVQEDYATYIDASARGETPVYEELFDLQEDSHETLNRVDDPAFAEVLRARRQRIGELLVACRGRRRLGELTGCVS